MNGLSGKKAEEFVKWLNEARHLIPCATTIDEARHMWEQLTKKEALEHEKESQESI